MSGGKRVASVLMICGAGIALAPLALAVIYAAKNMSASDGAGAIAALFLLAMNGLAIGAIIFAFGLIIRLYLRQRRLDA